MLTKTSGWENDFDRLTKGDPEYHYTWVKDFIHQALSSQLDEVVGVLEGMKNQLAWGRGHYENEALDKAISAVKGMKK